MFFFMIFNFWWGRGVKGLAYRKQRLIKVILLLKKNHGDKHNTKLLLTVVTVIEHISGYVHIKYF